VRNERRLALIGGLLYLVTFATSIPGAVMEAPMLASGASPALATSGALLEVILAFANVGTAVVLFPILRRHNEPLALGFVVSRTLESGLVFTGILAVLSLVTMSPRGGGGAVIEGLVALHGWAFLLGPGLMPAANAALFGSVLLRYRLVPRIIPLVGLIGAPLLVASAVGTMFGAWTQESPVAAVLALPIALWELAIGLWLVFRGVRGSSPVTR
jgi:hypothetical protein